MPPTISFLILASIVSINLTKEYPEECGIVTHEVQQATENFYKSSKLGPGAFGSVYKDTVSEGWNIAKKIFNLRLEDENKSNSTSKSHQNQIKPRFSSGLRKWLYSRLLFRSIAKMDHNLCCFFDIGDVYTIPVVHCDLKPSNILLDGELLHMWMILALQNYRSFGIILMETFARENPPMICLLEKRA
ncbi:conserved hypothetical protein [Ricinus communis]|uniref:Protein kinase domain-containing protein n=1 Tax=Ricinus communis TaxID=3988 RepID=B9S8B1_RICCO|nr:conserved hypothetical protein [Ricinus communis]